MEIRTENLTILFVDIAGFTATTSRQSRLQNAHLLQTFEKTLLPLIKRFKGNVVKSIGDALLLTFRSPTDAMLCSMALQDAMHAHNLNAPDDEKIHIRVAANLGEVRVTKKDIFGEPVNLASRIEGVAPADEIYLSEAVYMAMNKAEVPAQEVGFKELAGFPQPVKLYSIPRFATHRLVPQNQLPPDQGNELLFPYGGMHQRVPERTHSFRLPEQRSAGRYGLIAIGLLAGVALAWVGGSYLLKPGPTEPATLTGADPASQPDTDSPVIEIPRQREPATVPTTGTAETATAPTQSSKIVEKAVIEPEKTAIVPATTQPSANQPVAEKAAQAKQTTSPATSSSKPAPVEPAPPRQLARNEIVVYQAKTPATSPSTSATSSTTKPAAQATNTAPTAWSVTSAKTALRAGQIDKAEYRRITDQLELDYEAKIRELKLAYRAKQISEAEYEEKVREAKRAYSGR